MQFPISITGFASISPLGAQTAHIWEAYLDQSKHFSKVIPSSNEAAVVGALTETDNALLQHLREENPHYKAVDKTVLMAVFSARNAMAKAGWKKGAKFGINMGSSRGATGLFEEYHADFLKMGKAATLSSPITTLGNIATWVANDLQAKGPDISHSITCSTALHAVLNGVAWLQAGMVNKFMVGGSEAPLTPFTIAQMRALKIYTTATNEVYPCRALDLAKKSNQMFLGEGAAVFCLEKGILQHAQALITGVGYATEELTHNISISEKAVCFQESMKMALKNSSPKDIDAVVMHAPGTIKGDLSEYKAIQSVFGDEHMPFLTGNKWKIGHSFGASGGLSMELAILMLQHNTCIPVPFITEQKKPNALKKILVNAVGFGGNAVSILLEKV